jgi:hypothetical protein
MIALAIAAAVQPAPARVPVVVELFTSEGCSSCPPADALLSKLVKEQPVAGVEIVPLGMHVTYWDQLGWKDPASLPMATERQQAYGRIFGADRVYTPQAVIDGHDEMVGSDESAIRRALAAAGRQAHGRLTLTASITVNDIAAEVNLSDVPAVREPLEASLAITEDDLTSIVKRGENGGRTLHNDAVVRGVFGSDVGAARMLSFHAKLNPTWRRDRLRLAAVLQGKTSRRIYGAATTGLK